MKIKSTILTGADESRNRVGNSASDHLSMLQKGIGGNETAKGEEKLLRYTLGLCALAYKDPTPLRLAPGIAEASTIETFSRGSMHALGVQTKKGNFLVFRGTDSIFDWAYNLCFAPVPIPWPPRHAGFHMAWKALRRQALDWVDRVADGASSDFIIAGHSLGGAMAVLAAQEMAIDGRRIKRVVTLGAPRAGGYIFSSRYEKTPANLDADQTLDDVTWRVVNETDAVARSPLWLLNFRHVGRLMYIDRGGVMRSGMDAHQALTSRAAEMFASIGPPSDLPPRLPEAPALRERYFGSSFSSRHAVRIKRFPNVIRHLDFWMSAAFPKLAGTATACLARTVLLLSGGAFHHFSSSYIDAFYPQGDAPFSRLRRPAPRLVDRLFEWILFVLIATLATGSALCLWLLISRF